MTMLDRKFFVILLLLSTGVVFQETKAEDLQREMHMAQIASLPEQSPFGILEFLHWNHPWNSHKYPDKKTLEKAIALMKEAGIGWVRMDFLWSDIEPQQGKFDFKKYDEIVELLSRNNIRILGLLNYSTDWASSCGQWNCPPANNQLFVDYAVTVARRYKEKVKHWEVWNEPDSHIYWIQQDGLVSYCDLLRQVFTALKKEDPQCKVLNGGFANGISSVNRLYDNGAKPYFDILNIHVFDSPLNPGSVGRIAAYPKAARRIVARHRDAHKELWITETGCPGVPAGVSTANWWMGQNPNEAEQAAYLKDIFTRLIEERYADKIFWAFFRDCNGHWSNGTDFFGLVRWDFSKKPSFKAYQEVFTQWKAGLLEAGKTQKKPRGINPWEE